MTVLAAHKVDLDISAASEFGRIVYAADRYVYGDELGSDGELPVNVEQKLLCAAQRFKPEHDYLLLVGDHVQFTILSAMIARMHGTFRILRFDRHVKGYIPIRAWHNSRI